MINQTFIDSLGVSSPYRMMYNKNYNTLVGVDSVNDSGFLQIKIPYTYYSIEKVAFNYKAYETGQTRIAYVVMEVFFKLVPGSEPIHNIRFAEETGDPLRNKKEICMYSRQGASSSQIHLNTVFDNSSTSIGWDFYMTPGASFTGDLSVWMEFSGNYYQ